MEQFHNIALTTLVGPITSDDLSLTLASAATFPSTGTFRLGIGLEILVVTAIAGAVCTVVRGAEGTTAASHAAGSVVEGFLTAGALAQLKSDVLAAASAAATSADAVVLAAAITPGVCTLEKFDAEGDGTADDTPAIAAVGTAYRAVDPSDEALSVGARTYLTTGSGQLPLGLAIIGHGPQSLFKSVTNAPIIMAYDASSLARARQTTWAFLGAIGSGKASGLTAQDGFRIGYFGGDGSGRTLMLGLYAQDIGGIAFLSPYSDKLGTGAVDAFLRAESCQTGLVGAEGESHGFQAIDCTIGVRIGGNHVLIGGGFETCATAYQLSAGGNDAHGMMLGVSFTHNTIVLDYGATNNGQYAVGIRIFQGDINIATGNLKFHLFADSLIAPSNFNVNGKSRWANCIFGTAYYIAADFTDGENEFINPLGEDGTVPQWIGQTKDPAIGRGSIWSIRGRGHRDHRWVRVDDGEPNQPTNT